MNDRDPFYSLYSRPLEKTPYQLDLEVKDRKPDIVPKAGDKVKIKSREWYEKWKDERGDIDGVGMHRFVPEMSKYCGKVFNVDRVTRSWFTLEDASFGWNMFMFEEVYPQESSKDEKCAKAFEALAISVNELDKAVKATSAIPAINPIQGVGIPADWRKLVSDAPAVITLPNNFLSRECTQVDIEHLRSKWGLNKEPELQTIKRHRFIKLEKL